MTTCRDGESGLTLMEVLVSLALFSLIGIAGFSITDSILRTQRQVEGRLDRLGEIQRAFHLITLDFEQVADQGLTYDGKAMRFRRFSGARTLSVAYRSDEVGLRREVIGGFGTGASLQTPLSRAKDVRWLFYSSRTGWLDIWPPEDGYDTALPRAIAAELSVDGNTLRRVVRLPDAAFQ